MTTPQVQAGWYADPLDPAQWRWWDGTQWTGSTHPRVPEPAAVVVPAGPAAPLATPAAHAETAAQIRAAEFAWGNEPVHVEPVYEYTPIEQKPPTTVWIWLLAFGTIIWGIVTGTIQGVALGFTAPLHPTQTLDLANVGLVLVVATVIGLIPLWVFAALDIRTLDRRAYDTASILWMLLLPPAAYFLARRAALRRDGASSPAPNIVFWIIFGLQAAGVAVTIALGAITSLAL